MYNFPGQRAFPFPAHGFGPSRNSVKRAKPIVKPKSIPKVEIKVLSALLPQPEPPTAPAPVMVAQVVEHPLAAAALAGRLSAVRFPKECPTPPNMTEDELRAFTVARCRRLASAFGNSRPSLQSLAGYSNKARRGAL